MPESLVKRFSPMIRQWSVAELEAEIANPQALRLRSSPWGHRHIDVAYAPFEQVNQSARIVIVGLTPGRQQMGNALRELRRALLAGNGEDEALAKAKVFASFSGPMRANLVALLDFIGVNRVLGIAGAASLWAEDSHLVHFTSALRNPVFLDGENYSGNPPILTTPILLEEFRAGFQEEAQALRDALIVPLGPRVTEAVAALVREGLMDEGRILSGLPHPSGANAERIAYFLERKPQALLSGQVAPEIIDAARTALREKIARIPRADT